MNLDKRQRAMLREMGVRVWQPVATVIEVVPAMNLVANSEEIGRTAGYSSTPAPAQTATTAKPSSQRLNPPLTAAPAVLQSEMQKSNATWHVGQAKLLYPEAAIPQGARWLLVAETAAGLSEDPFQGDSGKLLNNMLRAARLNQAAAAWLVPLIRQTGTDSQGLTAALAALVAQTRPDVVLVMGRLAAQALLNSNEALGKLRGQAHQLHAVPTLVTYDAAYLLRSPADKAKAWDDLCLALHLTASCK